MVRDRWPNDRWSSGIIQRAERSSSYVFFLIVILHSSHHKALPIGSSEADSVA
jgi:hypothetical protein